MILSDLKIWLLPAVSVPGAGGGCGVVSGGGGHGAAGGGGGGGAQGGGGGGQAAAGPRQAGPHVLQSLLVPLTLAAEVSWDIKMFLKPRHDMP